MVNSRLIVVIFIVIIVAGALALTTLMKPDYNQATGLTVNGTKLSFQNNGNTWVHINPVFENVTLKNGTTQTFYGEMWIKPKGNVTMDLSNLFGYGGDVLPPGTTIRIIAWKGLYNNTTSSNSSELNLKILGWSNSLQPGASDRITDINFPGLNIDKLPDSITDNKMFFTTVYSNLRQQLGFVDERGIYEEEVITVDQDGKVTVTVTALAVPPELCAAAGDNETNWPDKLLKRFGLS